MFTPISSLVVIILMFLEPSIVQCNTTNYHSLTLVEQTAQGICGLYFSPPPFVNWTHPIYVIYSSDDMYPRNVTFWKEPGPKKEFSHLAIYAELPASTEVIFLMMDSVGHIYDGQDSSGLMVSSPGIYVVNASNNTITTIGTGSAGCPGIPAVTPMVLCSGQGSCGDNKECKCETNYTGLSCNMCTACGSTKKMNVTSSAPLTPDDYYVVPNVYSAEECCAYAVASGTGNWVAATYTPKTSTCLVYAMTSSVNGSEVTTDHIYLMLPPGVSPPGPPTVSPAPTTSAPPTTSSPPTPSFTPSPSSGPVPTPS
eukprot:PhF_6_TR31517/c0_g1_i2/m.46446